MHRIARYALVVVGLLAMIVTAGFFFGQGWATRLLPWPGSRLSNIFISSILAASAVPVIWVGLGGELGALVGGSIDIGLMSIGVAILSFRLYAQDGSKLPILIFGIITFALVVVCVALVLWSRRIPLRDQRPIPRFVTISFGAFALILLLVGGGLALQVPNIFPWVLSPELSVIYGWIFLGAACYFTYALINPKWSNAQGQLLGFLAYDIVLIVPLLGDFAAVSPNLRINLTVYVIVIAYSGLLAIYYLFINKPTRFELKSGKQA